MRRDYFFNILTILLIPMLTCCKSSSSNSDNEIYSLILDSQTDSADQWRERHQIDPRILMPPDGLKTHDDSIEYNNAIVNLDSVNMFRRNADLIIAIEDSTNQFSQYERKTIGQLKINDEQRQNLVSQLLMITRRSHVNISSLGRIDNYILMAANDSFEDKRISSIVTQVVSFSKITYSDDKSYACVYYSSVCGGDCGGGSIFFLEYTGSVWNIVEELFLWVA